MEFGHLETIEVEVDENYLLELLPCKAYNSTGVNIHEMTKYKYCAV